MEIMGVLGIARDAVTLVNRTSRVLNVRYDGEDISIPPGEFHGFPKVAVQYAKNQNPLMGSKHPIDPRKFICMVGVKAKAGERQKDDITPIPDEVLAAADRNPEVADRSGAHWGEPMEPRQLLRKAKQYSSYEAQVEIPGQFDVNRNIE
jgi:hypothetical protein